VKALAVAADEMETRLDRLRLHTGFKQDWSPYYDRLSRASRLQCGARVPTPLAGRGRGPRSARRGAPALRQEVLQQVELLQLEERSPARLSGRLAAAGVAGCSSPAKNSSTDSSYFVFTSLKFLA
jgi:hypothetical protein